MLKVPNSINKIDVIKFLFYLQFICWVVGKSLLLARIYCIVKLLCSFEHSPIVIQITLTDTGSHDIRHYSKKTVPAFIRRTMTLAITNCANFPSGFQN